MEMIMEPSIGYKRLMVQLGKRAKKTQREAMDRLGVKYPKGITVGEAIRRLQKANTKRAYKEAESLGMLNKYRKPRSDKGKRRKKK
jgi:hypothetical protein